MVTMVAAVAVAKNSCRERTCRVRKTRAVGEYIILSGSKGSGFDFDRVNSGKAAGGKAAG